ncbi:unnamed protein product [Leptosia nina]|uniref:C2H2-type domain-containing protein n=1 Tax=Leptosia nina TaxID=320188 RepID=A0AAV1JI48_9NEOP
MDPPPLVLCMDNINGDEVALKIEPHDDFRLFLDKAKSQLGFDIDINSITGNQPVSLDDNIYQFFVNTEKSIASTFAPNSYISHSYGELGSNAINDDLVYVLDDGTQINASQIQFDNEEPLIDITTENIPFIKYTDDPDEIFHNDFSIQDYNIESPVSRWSSRNSSPSRGKSFINSLPFKLVCNNTSNFESQFTKYLESSPKGYSNIKKIGTPEEDHKNFDDPTKKDSFTREDILNMFKDSPVTSLPYDKNVTYDKRKHARKTDPSRIVHRSWYKTNFDSGQSQDCCICAKTVENNFDKMYLFDNEDQRIHRCSPQKRTSVELKIICEQCLGEHFKLCLVKSPNEPLNSDEYLVIKNNQQYIFQNVTEIDLKKKFLDSAEDKEPEQHIDDGGVILESSSDVEIIEPEIEFDKAIDNLDDADEEVQEFLGKYQCDNLDELKCRFCNKIFVDFQEVMDHCEQHKHDVDDGLVYPCPLCDYGYATSKWLKGHIKTAHDHTKMKDEGHQELLSKESSPVATRTRSAMKKVDETDTKENQDTTATIALTTEVKQEALDSDEEAIWIVHTGDDVQEQELQKLLKLTENDNEEDTISQKVSDLTKHKCFNCSRIFPNAESLDTHKCRKRGKKRKFPAEKSSELCIPSKEDFLKKVRKKRTRPGSPQIVTCHNCNESFTSKVRLKFHMQFHDKTDLLTEKGEYTCNECKDTIFTTETELFDHVHFRHSKKKRWQCPVKECGKTFFFRATLTKHSRTHTDTRRYVCVTCGKRFLDKQTLDEHGVTHLQIKPFQCHICLKQLTRRSRLRMHLRAHEEELGPKLVLVCGICSRAFRDHVEAQKCLRTKLKQDGAEQLSPTSGLVTPSAKPESRLSKPVLREVSKEESEPLLTSLDDGAEGDHSRRENREGALNSHRVNHKGVKNPFICHVCKVTFATYSRCTTHKTTHGFYKRNLADGKKDEGASSAGILGYGGFPVVKHFLCEDCGRSYLHWTYLQVHRRTKHANENFLFKCNQCDQTFPNSWSVAYHRKKIHGKTAQEDGGTTKIARQDYYRIPCRDCDQLLPNKVELYKHRQKEHCDKTLDADHIEDSLTEKETTICSKCGHNLHNVNALHKHMKEVHDIEQDKLSCPVCSRTFRSTSLRNEHLRTHPNDRYGHPSSIRIHRPMHSESRSWSCLHCAKRFRMRSDLRAHLRLKHPAYVAVIEVEGLNLTQEQVIQQLALNNIRQDRVTEVSVMSFAKGTTNVVPNSQRALSLLSGVLRTEIKLEKQVLGAQDIIYPTGRMCKVSHTPTILQHSQVYSEPNYPVISTSDNQPINVQLLLQDGALANSQYYNQIV